MKLLIITQAVDQKHPILGFFHRWLEEFARKCETVTVIGQQVGDVHLPENVHIHSMGKEKGAGRIVQILRFWKLSLSLSSQYDLVLVHMTPIWTLLGAPLWILLRKPMYLWYEVRRGGGVLKASLYFVRKVFSATVHGLPWPSKKQSVVGHGIDTALFSPPTSPRSTTQLLAVGRITKIKRLDVILQCLALLPEAFQLRVIGPVITKEDLEYKKTLQEFIDAHHLQSRVQWDIQDQQGIAEAMRTTKMLLHGAGGGLDKVLLEAMSSGCPIVTCSEAGVDILPPACQTTPAAMPAFVQKAVENGNLEDPALLSEMRKTVEHNHSLPRLIDRLVSEMSH